MAGARRLIELLLVGLGRIELAISRRPRVLLAVTSLTSDRLLTGFTGFGWDTTPLMTPLVLSRWFPNLSSPGFIIRCLMDGVVAVDGDPRSVLDEYKPAKVLIDGFGNPWILEVARLAALRGIPVYALWHGPYFQDVRKEVLDHVSVVLSWGRGNEEWLERNGVNVPFIRVGNHIA